MRRQIKASTVNCGAKNVNGLSIGAPPAFEIQRSLACLFWSRQKQQSLEFPVSILPWPTNRQALLAKQRSLCHPRSDSQEQSFDDLNFLAKQERRDAKTALKRFIEL